MSEERDLLDSKTLSNLLGELLDSALSKELLAAVSDNMTDEEILQKLLQMLESEGGA